MRRITEADIVKYMVTHNMDVKMPPKRTYEIRVRIRRKNYE